MNKFLAVSGFSLVVALLLASPTFAQTSNQPPAATPAPAAELAEPAADTPIDELIAQAATPEDRRRLMLRCAGPPPRPMPVAEAAKSEPAAVELASAEASPAH
jgi:hypothetical protein